MSGISILMVSANFHPYLVGGAEKQALELSRELVKQGASVLVLTRRVGGLPRKDQVRGIPVRRLAAWGPGIFGSMVFMCSSFLYMLFHGLRYQAFHVHLAGSEALSAALAGKILRRRVVVKVGGAPGFSEVFLSSRTFLGRMKLKLLRKLAPSMTAVTQELVGEMHQNGLAGVPVRVVPNGVDTRSFRPLPKERKAQLAC